MYVDAAVYVDAFPEKRGLEILISESLVHKQYREPLDWMRSPRETHGWRRGEGSVSDAPTFSGHGEEENSQERLQSWPVR